MATFYVCNLPVRDFTWFMLTRDCPGGSVVESTCNSGDTVSIPGSGRPPGQGSGSLPRCSDLGSPVDRGARRASPWGHKESDKTERLNDASSGWLFWLRGCLPPAESRPARPRDRVLLTSGVSPLRTRLGPQEAPVRVLELSVLRGSEGRRALKLSQSPVALVKILTLSEARSGRLPLK